MKIHYWLKLIFFPVGLAPLTLLDTYQSRWKATLLEKLKGLGIPQQTLIATGFEKARTTIRQRIWDVELQCHMSEMIKHPAIRDHGRGFSPANYLSGLQVPKYRRSFTLARFNVLPSALLQGRFEGKPYTARVCPCGSLEVETASHVLLRCRLYEDIRLTFITPVLQKSRKESEYHSLKLLLEDKNPKTTLNVAKFCASAINRRKQVVSHNVQSPKC